MKKVGREQGRRKKGRKKEGRKKEKEGEEREREKGEMDGEEKGGGGGREREGMKIPPNLTFCLRVNSISNNLNHIWSIALDKICAQQV